MKRRRRIARWVERGTRFALALGVYNLAAYGAEWSTLASLGAMVVTVVLGQVIAAAAEYAEALRSMGAES